MKKSSSSSSFLDNYENTINILSLENKYSILEKDLSLEKTLLWRRRQPLYKSANSSTASLDSLVSNNSNDENSLNIENKYKYQFECPNSIASLPVKNINSTLNEKLSQLRKQIS